MPPLQIFNLLSGNEKICWHSLVIVLSYVFMAEEEISVQAGPPLLSRSELEMRIRLHLATTGVKRALLFGSYARGTADAFSDVDLVFIEDTLRPFVERGLAHLPLFKMGVGVDLLVYTPKEYQMLKEQRNPLVERVEEEGITIYEDTKS